MYNYILLKENFYLWLHVTIVYAILYMVANNHKGQIMIKTCSVFGHSTIEITKEKIKETSIDYSFNGRTIIRHYSQQMYEILLKLARIIFRRKWHIF